MTTTKIPEEKKLYLNGFADLTGLSAETINDSDQYHYKPTKDGLFLIYVKANDADNINNITVKAGDYFQNKRLGADNDYVLAVGMEADNDVCILGPFESAKFKNEDGEVVIEFDTTGTATTEVAVLEIELSEE